jgi:hypothetical protein
MYYIHIVCFWIGNLHRIDNLYKHIDALKTLKYETKFIVVIMTDDMKPLNEFKNFDVTTLYCYNSGGTIKALYTAYKWLLTQNISDDTLIGMWEDDWCFNSPDWLNVILPKLENNIYVGALYTDNQEFLSLGYKYLSKHNDVSFHTYDNTITLSVPDYNGFIEQKKYKWTDGSPYIFKFKNLKLIEQKIGKFTLAPDDERYQHGKHGIYHGEVGFPTRLSVAGFKFFGFDNRIYIKPLIQETNVIHK